MARALTKVELTAALGEKRARLEEFHARWQVAEIRLAAAHAALRKIIAMELPHTGWSHMVGQMKDEARQALEVN